MTSIKSILLSAIVAGMAVLAPTMASAEPYHHHHGHQVCHYDHHHHRSCHWVD